mmetsp:Transcript_32537/g.52338  ORF Transcript_32537/g.52338 Transcript_32537/m.52338 type:complete len:86 (-) Transcript_32537:84-341(-)
MPSLAAARDDDCIRTSGAAKATAILAVAATAAAKQAHPRRANRSGLKKVVDRRRCRPGILLSISGLAPSTYDMARAEQVGDHGWC